MNKIVVLLTGIIVLGGCSQAESIAVEQAVSEDQKTEIPVVVTPTKTLAVEIGGMSCEMGCGAAIRKELLATGAVERVKFDFKMGRDLNTAEISYDDSKISEEKITTIISELNEKQFNVGQTSVSDYERPAEESGLTSDNLKPNTNTSVNKSFSNMESPDNFKIKTPNLIDLLVSALVRR